MFLNGLFWTLPAAAVCLLACWCMSVLSLALPLLPTTQLMNSIDNSESFHDEVYRKLSNKEIYNKAFRPYYHAGKPTIVHVDIFIKSLRDVNERNMDFKIHFALRQTWNDPRLASSKGTSNSSEKYVQLSADFIDNLWLPDTFINNAIASENMQHSMVRIAPKGEVYYSQRLAVTADCAMDLTLYPFDEQTCHLSFESYGFTAENVAFDWLKSSEDEQKTYHKNIKLPNFNLNNITTFQKYTSVISGNYSGAVICFHFQRSKGFFVIQLFIPAVAVVCSSWIVLLIKQESAFSDMINLKLTITLLYFSYASSTPTVSHVKSIDVFIMFCFVMVVLALIHIAGSNSREAKKRAKRKQKTTKDKVDNLFCVFFPVIFSLFCVGYFVVNNYHPMKTFSEQLCKQ